MAEFRVLKVPSITLTAEVIRADGTREVHVYPAKLSFAGKAILAKVLLTKAIKNIGGRIAALIGRHEHG